MASEALERILETAPAFGWTGMYTTIDVYASGTAALYTPKPKPNLVIRDLPASGLQLHIHEGHGGTSHLKTYKGDYININSYDAAMMDWELDRLIAGLKSRRIEK